LNKRAREEVSSLFNSGILVKRDLFDYNDLASICLSKSSEAVGGSIEELFDSFRVIHRLKNISIANMKGRYFGSPLVQISISVAKGYGNSQLCNTRLIRK